MKNLLTNLITGYFDLLTACVKKADDNGVAEVPVYLFFLLITMAVFVIGGIIIENIFDLLSQLFYLPVQIMERNAT